MDPERFRRIRAGIGKNLQVIADKESKVFKMGNGTRQGDPLSPSLFNAVLEHVMRMLKTRWPHNRYGINIGVQYLQNVRFADDILLLGSTRAEDGACWKT